MRGIGAGAGEFGAAGRKIVVLTALVVALGPACQDERAPGRGLPPVAGAPASGFREVVDGVLPAIVFIQAEAMLPPGFDPLLPEALDLPDEPVPIGAGSGFLFRKDGYILTNNHVVQDAERVLVVLHDRRFFDARVVGRDPSTEVAVVRIEGNGFPVARIGDSDRIGPGDWVLAVGSPLGLQFSVTAGIVSGTGRALGILSAQAALPGQAAALEHFIQTDAALSPGNSGGPLVNMSGEVIGINTAVAAERGAPAAHGFAIPSNIARRVAEQLVARGEVRRPYLGLLLLNVTPMFARAHGLPTVEGAAVVRIEAGSPAHRAGIEEGDVIIRMDERPVRTVSDLQAALTQAEPGPIRLRVLRQGRALEVDIAPGTVRSGVGPGG